MSFARCAVSMQRQIHGKVRLARRRPRSAAVAVFGMAKSSREETATMAPLRSVTFTKDIDQLHNPHGGEFLGGRGPSRIEARSRIQVPGTGPGAPGFSWEPILWTSIPAKINFITLLGRRSGQMRQDTAHRRPGIHPRRFPSSRWARRLERVDSASGRLRRPAHGWRLKATTDQYVVFGDFKAARRVTIQARGY